MCVVVSIQPDYRDFDEYEADRLADKSTLEQLLLMDSELANYVHLSRYIGPLHPADLFYMRSAYDTRFSDFINDRLNDVSGESIGTESDLEFAEFREVLY